MATATRKCKVCGCEYEYCHTVRQVAGVFRWQDVACSPEHGSIYLAKIIKSRSKINTMPLAVNKELDITYVPVKNLDEDEIDELFEDEFDDDTEEPAIETK